MFSQCHVFFRINSLVCILYKILPVSLRAFCIEEKQRLFRDTIVIEEENLDAVEIGTKNMAIIAVVDYQIAYCIPYYSSLPLIMTSNKSSALLVKHDTIYIVTVGFLFPSSFFISSNRSINTSNTR